ncbi:inositol-pentakisphosphate 2-kinase-domain-containing protein [Daldinia decipiens]|uniref:inositol-pentakisphosphate 2-kinase-domain-containing protein n=1 Tax=Daldinia decipiens TaxID=326647 RepID=UPI0020C4D804|nr:inositol-pentakisphosphate 2-kinase-domain-containing protein [Daldinia decipiens]KAI1661743.1 inositol-pentakisphosphate 2-kinase-domain-containing protein [Daldinia decipiens]
MKPLKDVWSELSKPLPAGLGAKRIGPALTPKELYELSYILHLSEFTHLAEGRANAVFSIREPKDPTIPSGFFRGTLLRVPKATPDVTPCDYETLQDFQEKFVDVHVGRQHIVPQILIQIPQAVADALNLKRDNALRAKGIRGDQSIIQAGHAMLVEDMGPSPDYIALEFKPKWLAQAPMAPENAARCRTCAREALRNGKLRKRGHKITTPVCPLGLLHKNHAVVMSTIDQLAPKWSERDRARLAKALRESGVLERLRDLQEEGDSGDALFTRPSDANFGLSMTLRDCSCFVRMPIDEDAPVIIKLADVDKKNWLQKQSYWQKRHDDLVIGGWYDGSESPPIETACVLRLDYCLKRGLEIPPAFHARLKR